MRALSHLMVSRRSVAAALKCQAAQTTRGRLCRGVQWTWEVAPPQETRGLRICAHPASQTLTEPVDCALWQKSVRRPGSHPQAAGSKHGPSPPGTLLQM